MYSFQFLSDWLVVHQKEEGGWGSPAGSCSVGCVGVLGGSRVQQRVLLRSCDVLQADEHKLLKGFHDHSRLGDMTNQRSEVTAPIDTQ